MNQHGLRWCELAVPASNVRFIEKSAVSEALRVLGGAGYKI